MKNGLLFNHVEDEVLHEHLQLPGLLLLQRPDDVVGHQEFHNQLRNLILVGLCSGQTSARLQLFMVHYVCEESTKKSLQNVLYIQYIHTL